MHVEAFLRVIGLSQYVNTFRSNSVEGHALLELTNQDVLQNSFYMNAQVMYLSIIHHSFNTIIIIFLSLYICNRIIS